jgi:hypothetical protein
LFNPLNAELNSICHFLALLEAHHILHVSRIRVNVKLMLGGWIPKMLSSDKRCAISGLTELPSVLSEIRHASELVDIHDLSQIQLPHARDA